MSRKAQKGRRALATAGTLLVIGAQPASAHLADPPAGRAGPAPQAATRPPVDLRSADAKAAEIESGAVSGADVDLRSADARAAELQAHRTGPVAVARMAHRAPSTGSHGLGAGLAAVLLALAVGAITTTRHRTRRRGRAVIESAPVASR